MGDIYSDLKFYVFTPINNKHKTKKYNVKWRILNLFVFKSIRFKVKWENSLTHVFFFLLKNRFGLDLDKQLKKKNWW